MLDVFVLQQVLCLCIKIEVAKYNIALKKHCLNNNRPPVFHFMTASHFVVLSSLNVHTSNFQLFHSRTCGCCLSAVHCILFCEENSIKLLSMLFWSQKYALVANVTLFLYSIFFDSILNETTHCSTYSYVAQSCVVTFKSKIQNKTKYKS